MTAFCKDHGACLPGPAPVPTDIAVSEVPVCHILNQIHMNQAADSIGIQQLLDSGKYLRITQDMSYCNDALVSVSGTAQRKTFLQIGRDGFFKQKVIPFFHRRDSMPDMLAVLCGNDGHIAQARNRSSTTSGRVSPV